MEETTPSLQPLVIREETKKGDEDHKFTGKKKDNERTWLWLEKERMMMMTTLNLEMMA